MNLKHPAILQWLCTAGASLSHGTAVGVSPSLRQRSTLQITCREIRLVPTLHVYGMLPPLHWLITYRVKPTNFSLRNLDEKSTGLVLIFLIRVRPASLYSINKSTSTIYWIKLRPLDYFMDSAGQCWLHSLIGSMICLVGESTHTCSCTHLYVRLLWIRFSLINYVC